MDCARKYGRYGHRDAAMILVAYRHGLRASEVCDLQWQQIELSEGRLHVHRVKSGIPSAHPNPQDKSKTACAVCYSVTSARIDPNPDASGPASAGGGQGFCASVFGA
jgi:Phage integrase family